MKIRCNHCRMINSPRDRFCRTCGRQLDEAASPTPAQPSMPIPKPPSEYTLQDSRVQQKSPPSPAKRRWAWWAKGSVLIIAAVPTFIELVLDQGELTFEALAPLATIALVIAALETLHWVQQLKAVFAILVIGATVAGLLFLLLYWLSL